MDESERYAELAQGLVPSDELLRPLGAIAYFFGQIEFYALSLLNFLFPGGPALAMVLFSGESLQVILSKLTAVCDLLDPSHREQLVRQGDTPEIMPAAGDRELTRQVTAWVKKVRAIKNHRDALLHAFWLQPEDASDPHRALRASRRQKLSLKALHPRDLSELATQAGSVAAQGAILLDTTIKGWMEARFMKPPEDSSGEDTPNSS